MKLVVTDTNVFFDIINIDVLPEFFALDFEICTTDFVVKEILESTQKEQIESFIRANKLTVFKLSEKEVEEIRNFRTVRLFKGITDKTVLWKSYHMKCLLLTGDKKLRSEAEGLGIEVHGSLWVITQLVDSQVITKFKGGDLLDKLALINASLPNDEIDKLLKQFRQ